MQTLKSKFATRCEGETGDLFNPFSIAQLHNLQPIVQGIKIRQFRQKAQN